MSWTGVRNWTSHLLACLLIPLLSLYSPFLIMFGIFFCPLSTSSFLHLEELWDIESSLDGWAVVDFAQPFLYLAVSNFISSNLRSFVRFQNSDSQKIIKPNPRPLCPINPTKACQVSNGTLVTYDTKAKRQADCLQWTCGWSFCSCRCSIAIFCWIRRFSRTLCSRWVCFLSVKLEEGRHGVYVSLIPLDGIINLLWRVAIEMFRLAL